MSNDRVIEIIIETNDRTGGALGGLQAALLRLDAAVQRTQQRFRAFATTRYDATLSLIDRVTTPGSRINELLRRMAGRVYDITTRLTDGASSRVRELEARLMRLAGRAYTVAVNLKDNISGKLGGLTDGVLAGAGVMAGTAGIGFGVVNAIQSQMDFEKQMSAVAAITGAKSKFAVDVNGNAILDATGKAMTAYDQLIAKAKEMGATTQFTAKEAADALYYMGMAGWDAQKSIAALPAVLDLAAASNTDLGRTADIMTDTMTGFGLRAGEFVRDGQGQLVEASQYYADLLARTTTSANTDLSGLGESLKYSAPVVQGMYASQGADVQADAAKDALWVAGIMANAGVKGSQAGTSMRSLYTRLAAANQNAESARWMLGVDIANEDGTMKSQREIIMGMRKKFNEGLNGEDMLRLVETLSGEEGLKGNQREQVSQFLEGLQARGGKLTDADKLKFTKMLAGQEAMSGWLSLFLGSDEDLEDLYNKLNDVNGAAHEMAEIQLDNLAGSFTMLESAWDAFQRSFVEGKAGDGLRSFIDAATEVVTRANNLFKDGIDLSDFAVIIGDVIDRLKRKFLEFDGIGSVLAGGALIGALVKIAGKVRSVMDSIRELRSLNIGDRINPPSGGGGRGLGGGQNVSTMTVHANVVNINSRSTSQGGPIPPGTGGPTPPNGGPTPPSPSRSQRMARGFRNGGLAAVLFAGLDVASQYSQSQENIAAADDEIQAAQDHYTQIEQSGRATETDLAQARTRVAIAETKRQEVIRQNKIDERTTMFGSGGAIVGAATGAALGSVIPGAGTVVGGILGLIGGMLGQMGGEKLASLESVNEYIDNLYTKTDSGEKASYTPAGTAMPLTDSQSDYFKERSQAVLDFFKPTTPTAEVTAPASIETVPNYMMTGYSYTPQVELPKFELPDFELPNFELPDLSEFSSTVTNFGESITETFSSALESVSEFGRGVTTSLTEAFESAPETFSSLGESITSTISTTMTTATELFNTASSTVQEVWGAMPSFFEGVFSGLASIAAAAGAGIAGGINSAIGVIQGAWEGLSSWLSGKIASLKNLASEAASFVGIGGGSERAMAEGGFVTSPQHILAGEAGTEVIIPLSSSKRPRAMDLIRKAIDFMGGDSSALEPLNPMELLSADENLFDDPPISLPNPSFENPSDLRESSGGGIEVNVGGVHVEFNVDGSQNPQDFMTAVRENLADMADQVGGQIAEQVRKIFHNQPLMI